MVTLARSVAHLSSEMRTQHVIVQEIEQIRQELQQVKLNYLAQVNRAGIGALMEELDELTSPGATTPEPPATPPA